MMTQIQIRALNAQLYFLAFLIKGWWGLFFMIGIHILSLVWDMSLPMAAKYLLKLKQKERGDG